MNGLRGTDWIERVDWAGVRQFFVWQGLMAPCIYLYGPARTLAICAAMWLLLHGRTK